MPLPIILTLLSSFIWAITSYIDKYVLCKIDNFNNSLKTTLIFSTLIVGIIFSPIWLIKLKFNIFINFNILIIILISTLCYILSMFFYFKALENNDTSIVASMFQLVPIFSYILSGIFFNEILSLKELIGAIIIILSAIIISYDFDNNNNKNKTIALLYMFFSSMFEAVYYFTFEISMRNSNYELSSFWYQVFLLLIGVILINIKSYKNSFINMLKVNGKKFINLNFFNESLNLIANLMVNFANLTIPIAIANTLNSFQGFFVFFIGIIGTMFFPKFISEDLSMENIVQKILCITFSLIGIFIMFY